MRTASARSPRMRQDAHEQAARSRVVMPDCIIHFCAQPWSARLWRWRQRSISLVETTCGFILEQRFARDHEPPTGWRRLAPGQAHPSPATQAGAGYAFFAATRGPLVAHSRRRVADPRRHPFLPSDPRHLDASARPGADGRRFAGVAFVALASSGLDRTPSSAVAAAEIASA